MELNFFVAILLTGIVSGTLSGMLGIGGGIIIVPVLLFFYSLWPGLLETSYLAVGTSLGAVFLTSLSSSYAHYKRSPIDWSIVRLWVLPLMVGGFVAGQTAALIAEHWLVLFIGILLLVFAIILASDWQPAPRPHTSKPNAFGVNGLAFTVGLISALAGIGGGNIIVPSLIYWFHLSFLYAIAISSVLVVPIALSGAAGFALSGWNALGRPPFSLGYLHLPVIFTVALTAVLFAPLGVKIAYLIHDRLLKIFFGCVLLVTSARLIWLSFGTA